MQEKPKHLSKIQFNISDTQYSIISKVAQSFNWSLVQAEDDESSDIIWTDNAVSAERLSKLRAYQKINHFPGMDTLSRKNNLSLTLQRLQRLLPERIDFYPKTWLLPIDQSDLKTSFGGNRVFIVKPEASCQGKGIYLVRKFEEITPAEKVIVQQYISDPFLIDGLKFDLRVYALVTGCDPLRVFVHESGLTRLATEPYAPPSKHNLTETLMHLTNYAVNKSSSKYVKNHEKGHKRSLASTFALLSQKGYNVRKLRKQIDRIIATTLISSHRKLVHIYKCSQPEDVSRGMCFEILGFDILLDSNLKPWLLEVNHSPSFSTDSMLDLKVKTEVISDSLQLMNINSQHKKDYLAGKKAEFLQKQMFPKSNKDVKLERLEAYQNIQDQRTEWENSNLGRFRRILPSNRYTDVVNAANFIWNDWGSKKNKTRDPSLIRKKVLLPTASPIRRIVEPDLDIRMDTLNSTARVFLSLADKYKTSETQPTREKKNRSKYPNLGPLTTNDVFIPGSYVVPKSFGFNAGNHFIRPLTEIKRNSILKKKFY